MVTRPAENHLFTVAAPIPSSASETAASAVSVQGLARRFGRRWALRGVSLEVAPGEVVALIGHNGSGKTTLLRLLATAVRPTLGGGSVFGCDLVRDADRVRALVGLLGHAPGLYQDLTASENLQFAQRMMGERADEAVVDRMLGEVGLEREGDTRVRGFSSGMQRRLALARLLLRPPSLVLLDEPFASFDVDGIERVNAFIVERSAAGAAVIIATHDPDKAADLIDRTVRLEDGRLGQAGHPERREGSLSRQGDPSPATRGGRGAA